MDILDLDEELKNDSFFASEDKTHDDVLNILQQWKNNWGTLQDKEQAYAANSKTFVRPKKKITQSPHSQTSSNYSINQNEDRQNDAIVNLEIGGYVTNMHKSFLQDTSPPNSICSYIDVCNDQINNSLITSGDFTNISFLRPSNCSDSIECIVNNPMDKGATLTERSSYLADSFNNMLRDRKPLDSLTLSADGTLIKDCNIGQIDDISLALSKTASTCSTMNNSTNSNDSSPNIDHDESSDKNNTFNYFPPATKSQKSNLTMNIDMISNTSINLVNSFVSKDSENEENCFNYTQNVASFGVPNQTFRKAALPLDETICMLPSGAANTTFDMVQEASGSRCETPENINKTGNFCISTPHIGNVGPIKQQFTPHLDKTEVINLSPIVGGTKTLSDTFESDSTNKQQKKTDRSYGGGIVIDNKYNNNYAFNKNYQCFNDNKSGSNDPNVPNILELANAEAALLASNGDELQFEHMLEELSRIHTSYDQTKLKTSLNSIKKRLNCANDSIKNENASETAILDTHSRGGGDSNKTKNLSDTINKENSISSSSTSHDRLLNRRSRLYDNINLSMLPDNKSNSTELENVEGGNRNNSAPETITMINAANEGDGQEDNINNICHNKIPENTQNTQLTRRERDRDRFKTIKISSAKNALNSNVKNLPCIDNDGSVINNYGTENESIKTTNFQTYKDLKDEIKLKVENKSVTNESSSITQSSNIRAPMQHRSLSRPRYISGLQKFSSICKATSAGDLDTNSIAANSTINEKLTKIQVNAGVVDGAHNKGVLIKEMKSPMGIKSKSFHNLSFQQGSNGSNLVGASQLKNMQSKLMRPRTKTYQPINVERMQPAQTQKSSDVFKVPKAVIKPSNIKPACLPRPLSGCYSGSTPAKNIAFNSDGGIEHKPDTSKEKILALDSTINISTQNNLNQETDSTNQMLPKQLKSSAGIPRTSGIRPPTIKRSCLPRPSSITRH